MKKNIALVYGGDSSEYEVSLKSGAHVAQHIDSERYNVWEVMMRGAEWWVVAGPDGDSKRYPVDKADFSFVIPAESGIGGTRVRFWKAFVMIHGTPGEDGLLQAYFEMVGMPFTTSPASVSLLTFNKYACKCFLRDAGVQMAREIFLRNTDVYNTFDIIAKLGLPLFVKPNSGGSSFGVTKVKRPEELAPAIAKAFEEDDAILIEEFIDGREMTNGVFENGVKDHGDDAPGGLFRLPVTEIVSDNEFFDYEAKYMGASQEICPAPIPMELSNRIIDLSHRIYRHLGCRGIVRVDYIVRGGEIFFLEINTVPGMTEMSLVPQQVRAAGLTIKEFLNHLLGV